MEHLCRPIAVIRSPYREKFAAPRQPGLAPSATARIEFNEEFASSEAVRGLENFSHIWLIFLFHKVVGQGWKPTVRPPRLGGNQRVGVFACRSPFRPNPLGLSAVKLLAISSERGRPVLEVQGVDLIDGTPILDIKPYLPYTDGIAEASGGFAERAPLPQLPVEFTATARTRLDALAPHSPQLEKLICETLSLDPRPAYKQGGEDLREYGVLLDRYNIRWRVCDGRVEVFAIEPAGPA